MSISKTEVHIWIVPLNPPGADDEAYKDFLSADEISRADRFYFERHRRRFIISHHALRDVLAGYLAVDPVKIEFSAGPQGKPHLAGEFAASDIRFNLAHSHELAVIALGRVAEIGVDVEYLQSRRAIEQIAMRFFSPDEQTQFIKLPVTQRTAGFFNCWTRKEAFIKAVGEGLTYPLKKFDVTLVPDQPAQILRVGADPHEAGRWSLVSFQPAENYIAAVALRARNIQFKYFHWGASSEIN